MITKYVEGQIDKKTKRPSLTNYDNLSLNIYFILQHEPKLIQ